MRIPRIYQAEAINAVRDAFRKGIRGVALELCTGAGKSIIIAAIAKMVRDKGGRVLVLVNRDNLCEQLFLTLKEHGMHPTMERGSSKASPMSDCVVASIQTSQGQRLKKWNRNHFALVVTDEAHGSASKTFKSVLDHFESTYHVFMSATIERHDKRGLWKGVTEVVYTMSLQKGIDDGWLVPLELMELPVPIIIDDETATKKQFTQEDEDGIFAKKDYLPRLFEESSQRSWDRKSLFFWPNCKSSDEAAKHFNKNGVESRHADGYMSKPKLAEILEWFKTPGPKALHNADLYSYGFDAPFIQQVGIMRLSRSLPMLKQRIGRVTRPLCNVDDYLTADLRREAIRISDKPSGRILDLMIQLGAVKNKFADATALITDDEDEREHLRKLRKPGVAISMDEIEGKLKMKRKVDEDKALARLAEDAANAAARHRVTHSGPYLLHILGVKAKPHWKDASEKQVAFARHLGFKGDIESAWHGHRIITALQEHNQKQNT